MIYQGRELTELKYDTMQHWPEGRELLVWDGVDETPRPELVKVCAPHLKFPFITENSAYTHAAELPTVTKRRVTRAECAGMAVKQGYIWHSCYNDNGPKGWWSMPMPDDCTDRAHTLPDALAGRTLGMEVEG